MATVENEHDLEELPFWKQGDLELNSEEAMRAREALRTHPLVLEVLEAFWDLMVRMGECPNGIATELYTRIFKVLMPPSEWDPAEAATAVNDDYMNDCDGHQGLTHDNFADGLFELADQCAAAQDDGTRARVPHRALPQVTHAIHVAAAPVCRCYSLQGPWALTVPSTPISYGDCTRASLMEEDRLGCGHRSSACISIRLSMMRVPSHLLCRTSRAPPPTSLIAAERRIASLGGREREELSRGGKAPRRARKAPRRVGEERRGARKARRRRVL